MQVLKISFESLLLFCVSIIFVNHVYADKCKNTYRLKKNEASAFVRPVVENDIPDTEFTCDWDFYAQPNHLLIVKVEFEIKAPLAYITVYDNNTRIGRISTNTSMTYISVAGYIRLEYKLDPNNDADATINVTYKQFKQDCENSLTATSNPQSITSVSMKSTDCVWNIQGVYVNLTFNSLQLVDGDYLEVFEGPYQTRIFNESLSFPVTLGTITPSGIKVLYHKSSVSGTGYFSAIYQKVNCDETYQLNGTSSYTVNPEYPSYQHFDSTTFISSRVGLNPPLICSFYFEAQDDYLIEVETQLNSNKVVRRYIEAYDNLTLSGKWAGDAGTSNIISKRQKLRLKMSWILLFVNQQILSNLDVGITVKFRQFKPTCGTHLLATSTNQMIPSNAYLGTTGNVDCVWVITSTTNRYIQLIIAELDIEDEDGYLEVIVGLHRLKRFQQSSNLPAMLNSNVGKDGYSYSDSSKSITVYFHSDSQIPLKLFKANYTEVACGKTILTTDFALVYLSAPKFTTNAPITGTCDYIIIKPEYDFLTIEIYDRNFPSNDRGYLQIFKNNKLVKTMDSSIQKTRLKTIGSHIRLHLVSDQNIHSSPRYSINYIQFPSTCGSPRRANASEQFITSPGYPGNYKSFQDCVWVITANPQRKIRVAFDSLDVGSYGYLKITEDPQTTETYQGIISSPVNFVSTGDSITVHFHSDFNLQGHKGFNATFVEAV